MLYNCEVNSKLRRPVAPQAKLIELLEKEMQERDWRPADLARATGLGEGTISRILNGSSNAGQKSCNAIAKALGLPPEDVFRIAGIVSSTGIKESDLSEDEAELVSLYRELPPGEVRAYALSFLRGFVDQMKG